MGGEVRIVDDRVFLLGLDKRYREAMQAHERTELLRCAERVASVLAVSPAQVPVEGYYSEHPDLTAYFLLMRALRLVPGRRMHEVAALGEFRRLHAVLSSPLYGHPHDDGHLFPSGMDALSTAMSNTQSDWTVQGLTAVAQEVALETGDCSLGGLAARAGDAVVLAALRESVVLQMRVIRLGLDRPRYEWRVDPALAEHARSCIATFNTLICGGLEILPQPEASNASFFWSAAKENIVVGRCVRLGSDAQRHYHWAIRTDPSGETVVHEFWEDEVWTTQRYSRALSSGRDSDLLGLRH